jgi:hypothetical protein
VAALNRAVPLAECEHSSLPVAEHLDLHMAGIDERLLDVERSVREGGLCLGSGRREGAVELFGRIDQPHPSPAPAG